MPRKRFNEYYRMWLALYWILFYFTFHDCYLYLPITACIKKLLLWISSETRDLFIYAILSNEFLFLSRTSSSQASNNTFFDSLKRVQGALSPASKSKSTNRQDVKRSRPILEVSAKSSDKLKDKDRDRTKDKEKDKEKEKRSWFRSPSRSSLKKEVVSFLLNS